MIDMVLRPIGVVRSPFKKGSHVDWKIHPAQIHIYEAYAEGLQGIEAIKTLWVLWWMHDLSPGDREILLVHPHGNPGIPKSGVFSTRVATRPNPIGLTRVSLLKRDRSALTVMGLDAFDGSPVLDIKPEAGYSSLDND